MRTDEELKNMMIEDTAVGLACHYWPLSNYINAKGYKIGIEIGCAYGGLANHLLTNCPTITRLMCVDPYRYYPDMPGLFDQDDYDRLKAQTLERLGRIKTFSHLCHTSKDAYDVCLHRYNFIDFVFIDGLHEYETVKWEIEHYSKLIRPGGALLGHDYDLFPEVKKAVDEYCKPILLETNVWLKEL
jgi:predicted O-methyltransferase YrrM